LTVTSKAKINAYRKLKTFNLRTIQNILIVTGINALGSIISPTFFLYNAFFFSGLMMMEFFGNIYTMKTAKKSSIHLPVDVLSELFIYESSIFLVIVGLQFGMTHFVNKKASKDIITKHS
jgi:hypothetical protein